MAEVRAALRCGLHLNRNGSNYRSREAMNAWKQKSRAAAEPVQAEVGGAGRAQREP
jgi:hypothetical protein